jgi:purine-nucleoside phosphorylase
LIFQRRKPLNEDVILKPKPLRGFKGEKVLFIPFDIPSRPLRGAVENLAKQKKISDFGIFYQIERKIVLYQSIGAPSAVMSLERLIVSGAKEIILLGFCGALNPQYKMRDVVSITKALSEEGTSKHYIPRKKIFFPSQTLKTKIENTLHESMLFFHTGSLVSTDAPFRETKSWLTQKQKKGVDLVDMETSAVLALASFYGIQAAALMIVSDELWRNRWKAGFLDPRMRGVIKKYFLPFIKKS